MTKAKLKLDELFKQNYSSHSASTMTMDEYLELCRNDPMGYAFPAERMVDAIGAPVIVDTSKEPRLARLFGNKEISTYPTFSDFYGMEEVVEHIVNFFRFASQGLEESRQILYLLGPVGGGKSSLVARLRELMEARPIYVLSYKNPDTNVIEHSPYFSRVLPLFTQVGLSQTISDEYNIPLRYFEGIAGPWERKRLAYSKGDLSHFMVTKFYPSRFNQIGISEAEPGDENTQDVSTLVGKVDMRKLEEHSQNDPDAYLYSGALNSSNQGVLEFKEMFKAKIKMLNPLLFAVQEHNYQPIENIGALPYYGIVMAHSNESEWNKFRLNKDNEAFMDRICIVKVPYCLRIDEEIKIYEKNLMSSSIGMTNIAPGTLDILSRFSIMTRLHEPKSSVIWSKARVYNGENLREKDPKAKTYNEYREEVENRDEGFFPAFSTRSAFKLLSSTLNADKAEIGADPVHLMNNLLKKITTSDLGEEMEKRYKALVLEVLRPIYSEFIEGQIRESYLEAYADFGQNLFDRYFMWAEKWVDDEDFFESETGLSMNREGLNLELDKIEKPAGIANPKDFRNEVVKWVLRYRAKNQGNNPPWRSYEKLKSVIEKSMFETQADLLPVISFTKKSNSEEEKKHTDFVDRMKLKGYTERQIRVVVDWFMRVNKLGQ
jgi:serine protein kinase